MITTDYNFECNKVVYVIIGTFSLFNATQILSIANLPYCSPDRSTIPIRNPNRGIPIHHQEHQNSGAEFSISSKKHQFLNHQRRGWRQIPKIGEKSERERNFNIASKTACRGFKSFCPFMIGRSPKPRKMDGFGRSFSPINNLI